MDFYKIYSWDNERVYIWADDDILFEKPYAAALGTPLCENAAQKVYIEKLDLKFAHRNPTITIVILTNLNEAASNESWAIRDFTLYLEKCPKGCDTCKSDDVSECESWLLFKWSWTSLREISAEGWEVDGAKTEGTYECAGITMLGGSNKFGKLAKVYRTYKMPGHFRIKIKFTFIKMDTWDNEIAYLEVDGVKLWERKFHYNIGYFVKLCG